MSYGEPRFSFFNRQELELLKIALTATDTEQASPMLKEIDKQISILDEFKQEMPSDEDNKGREWALPKDFYFCIIPAVAPPEREDDEYWFKPHKRDFEVILIPKYLYIKEKSVVINNDTDMYFHDFYGTDTIDMAYEDCEYEMCQIYITRKKISQEETRKKLVKEGFTEKQELAEACIKAFDWKRF